MLIVDGIALIVLMQGQLVDPVSASVSGLKPSQNGEIATVKTEATAGGLVSQALLQYSEAKTVKGKILMVQSAMGRQARVSTDLQFERPSKLYLLQKQSNAAKFSWLITSDGNKFSYDMPDRDEDNLGSGMRLVESIAVEDRRLTVADIYAGSARSLGDRSTVLDFVFGRTEDLEFFRSTLVSMAIDAKFVPTSTTKYRIIGRSSTVRQGPAVIEWKMYIAPNGGINRFENSITRRVSDAQTGQNAVVTIDTVWTVDLTLNATVDPNLFKIVR